MIIHGSSSEALHTGCNVLVCLYVCQGFIEDQDKEKDKDSQDH